MSPEVQKTINDIQDKYAEAYAKSPYADGKGFPPRIYVSQNGSIDAAVGYGASKTDRKRASKFLASLGIQMEPDEISGTTNSSEDRFSLGLGGVTVDKTKAYSPTGPSIEE